MKHFCRSVLTASFIFTALIPLHATVILEDTFADGTRNNQNLPTDSAWYSSTGASLTAAPGAMTLAVGGSAIMALTYFAPSNAPVSLNVGDTLQTTIKFAFNNVDTTNTAQGFRIALCDFSTNRVSGDFSGNNTQGANVPAYALFQNMGVTFNSASPMDIRKRTTLTDSALLGTSSDWTSLVTGPGDVTLFPGFANGTQYSLQLSVQRTDVASVQITATWMNVGTGATISTNVTDASASNFNFDGIALRPQNAASSATNMVFNEVRVEYIAAGTPPSINTQPQDQSVFVGQNATFTVNASGTAPLGYQWYYNNDTPLLNATNASLTISNAQLSDTGGYSVTVSNAYGSPITSASANLTVSQPTAPSIVTQPQDQTVLPGQTATFTVVAGGSAPLGYQWYFNTNTFIPNATSDTLTVTNVQSTNGGTYSVVVSNFVNTTASAYAILTVNTNPVAPSFTSQPASQIVLTAGTAIFNATAAGTAPITYQWNKNGSPIPGANSSTLTLTNLQSTDAGSYTLTASNNVGGSVSTAAILTVTPAIPVVISAYNLVGFAGNTTGGGIIPETDSAYRKVTNALDLANALVSAYKTSGSVKVIEIMNDLDLGWNEIGAAVQNLASTPFRSGTAPKLHPVLLVTGESVCDIKPRAGLTIFSANGAAIRHCNFNIKSTGNIIIRNLKFDQNWEWDEATKGQYDQNDWDFITLGNGGAVSNIWIDHCTFTKSYDGVVDTKAGSSAITISWCNYIGDDGATNTNSWVWQQVNYLEQNPAAYPFYNFLRTRGFSTTNIVTIIQAHDKTHLAGANDLDSNNATISMTFHHLNVGGVWDRAVPRLRAGNVHDFNIYVDDTQVLVAKRLRDSIAASLSTADRNTLNNTYSINPPINGAISTESGALLVEKSVYINCLWPLRNNQTDPSNPAYTGKIQAIDSIYQFDTTTVRGNSTDPGNPMGPFQAAIIPFSWNLPGNQLPYTYTPDDPAQLQAIVTSPTAGAGAGVLTWAKTNWLRTSYAATAPFVVAQPQNVVAAAGQSATFTAFVGGSANLSYQWYFNTNTLIPNATNSVLTIASVQSTNAGMYSLLITNTAGSISSTNVSLTLSSTTAAPQLSAPAYSNGSFSLSVNGDPGHDYIIQVSSNLADWQNIFTNPNPTLPFIWNDTGAASFTRRFYRIQISP